MHFKICTKALMRTRVAQYKIKTIVLEHSSVVQHYHTTAIICVLQKQHFSMFFE